MYGKGTSFITNHANNHSFVILISNGRKQLRYEQCNIHIGISHHVIEHMVQITHNLSGPRVTRVE